MNCGQLRVGVHRLFVWVRKCDFSIGGELRLGKRGRQTLKKNERMLDSAESARRRVLIAAIPFPRERSTDRRTEAEDRAATHRTINEDGKPCWVHKIEGGPKYTVPRELVREPRAASVR